MPSALAFSVFLFAFPMPSALAFSVFLFFWLCARFLALLNGRSPSSPSRITVSFAQFIIGLQIFVITLTAAPPLPSALLSLSTFSLGDLPTVAFLFLVFLIALYVWVL